MGNLVSVVVCFAFSIDDRLSIRAGVESCIQTLDVRLATIERDTDLRIVMD